MKRNIGRILIFTAAALLALTALAACGKTLDGSWAYIHDPETEALRIKGSTAVLDGKEYDCTVTENGISLTADGRTTEHHIDRDGEDILFCKPTEYTYQGEGTPDGIVGIWVNEDTSWSFEFTAEGKFCEDGYFPGFYSLDEEAGTFRLAYDDHFEDTTCHYSVSGSTLTVEYPWRMVRMN